MGNQGTFPNKVESFKMLLRNRINKANTERGGTKRRIRKERVMGHFPAGQQSLNGY